MGLLSLGASLLGGIFGVKSKRDDRREQRRVDDKNDAKTDAFNAEQRANFLADRDNDCEYDRGMFDRLREDSEKAGFNPAAVLGSAMPRGSSGTSSAAPPLASTAVLTGGYRGADEGGNWASIFTSAAEIIETMAAEKKANAAPATSSRPVQRPTRLTTGGRSASKKPLMVAKVATPRLPVSTGGRPTARPTGPTGLWKADDLLPTVGPTSEMAMGLNGFTRADRDPANPREAESDAWGWALEGKLIENAERIANRQMGKPDNWTFPTISMPEGYSRPDQTVSHLARKVVGPYSALAARGADVVADAVEYHVPRITGRFSYPGPSGPPPVNRNPPYIASRHGGARHHGPRVNIGAR